MEKLSAERISDVINETPLVIEVDVKKRTLLEKIFKKENRVRVFTVNQPVYGTLIKISAEIEKMQGVAEMLQQKDIASILKHFNSNGNVVLNVLTLYIGSEFGLKTFLKNNITTTEGSILLMKLMEFSKLQDFMTTIILTKGMSLMRTEEIIAPLQKDKEKTLQELLET